jgi:hypothetical protein
MKWMFVGAWLAFACLPVWATTAHKHKTTRRKATQVHSIATSHSHAQLQHASIAKRSGEKEHAGFRTASYRLGYATQTSSSPTSTPHSSSKKKSTSKKKHSSKREPTQMAPTADRISEIQSALSRGGYYKADPNGKWDADTVDALQKFQSANGLDVNGKLDALTLQKLGLGSDVAGYSSPKGIASHSCCSMTPSPSHAPTPATPASATTSTASVSQPGTGGQPSPGSAGAASPATQENSTH